MGYAARIGEVEHDRGDGHADAPEAQEHAEPHPRRLRARNAAAVTPRTPASVFRAIWGRIRGLFHSPIQRSSPRVR